ncbi:hypothetical protein ACCT04_36110, partial [Rhizobium ruizarguesonis]
RQHDRLPCKLRNAAATLVADRGAIKMIRPILRLLTRHFLSAFILAVLLAAPLVILHTRHEKTALENGLLMEGR